MGEVRVRGWLGAGAIITGLGETRIPLTPALSPSAGERK